MPTPISSRLTDTNGYKTNIVGAVIEQIRFCDAGAAVRIILRGNYEKRFELAFDGELTLRNDREEWRLMGAIPGKDHNPQSCGALLALLGLVIERASVSKGEGLHLYFAHQWELIAGGDENDYPVWHFRLLKSFSE